MHARHLAQELPDIGVIAFNPSVVPGTEIGRDRNWLQKLGWKYIMPRLGADPSRRAQLEPIRIRSAVAHDRGGCTNPLGSIRRRQGAAAGLGVNRAMPRRSRARSRSVTTLLDRYVKSSSAFARVPS